ncbi:tetratricopeptide repeat protein [Borrelia miyamotoi]|uniref:tetratricopeptide repeat protein n=1 Tax=Borrelia miyamotoi TaxID=47466 RepID=UPI00126464AC|nr:tetratricopeptide repeat protein [Borrelia miyamotoi]QGT55695.1 tetratricopeptide repeat protein [Borrelia miyamotoi]QGT56477.1 tetratricopeptide repeat protein [Borrelia miyamotoi]
MINKSFCLKIIIILLSGSNLINAVKEKEDSLLLYKQGKFQEAIINTQEELKYKPKNLDARSILIWSLIAIGEYKRAELESIKGLEINKHDPRIIQALGEAYFFQGQYNNALKYFQKYISFGSNGARIVKVYILIADSFYKLERYNEADFAYENALRFLPNNQNILLKLAKSRLNAQNKILAKDTLIKVLTLNPNHSEAKKLLKKMEKSDHNS